MTKEELIAFEDEIAALFLDRKIRAPIHLSGGNEEQLINLFYLVKAEDWVLTTWRSHYHCLLKGVPREELKTEILKGNSISLCFPEYRILSSGIVGGLAPIAVGLGLAGHKVFCFLGDMAAETGIVYESMKYCQARNLPVQWIVEDNGKSVNVSTQEVWGQGNPGHLGYLKYSYQMTRDHVGAGKWVNF